MVAKAHNLAPGSPGNAGSPGIHRRGAAEQRHAMACPAKNLLTMAVRPLRRIASVLDPPDLLGWVLVAVAMPLMWGCDITDAGQAAEREAVWRAVRDGCEDRGIRPRYWAAWEQPPQWLFGDCSSSVNTIIVYGVEDVPQQEIVIDIAEGARRTLSSKPVHVVFHSGPQSLYGPVIRKEVIE